MVSTPPLSIRLFGPVSVLLHGHSLPPLRSRKGLWLLALLAIRSEEETDRAWLAGSLWPECLEENALYNLRRNLSQLRIALGREADRLLSPTPRTLRFDLTGCQVDLLAFRAALKEESRAGLEAAVKLYGGRLLAECDEEWSVPYREECHRAFLAALERLGEEALDEGDAVQAVRHLQRLVQEEPLSEPAVCALLRALAEARDGAGLVATYRDLRLRLHEELRCRPSPDTTALYESLREAVASAASEGSHKSYKSNETHKTYKTDETAEPPPLAEPAPPPTPNNLGRRLVGLIGRQQELRDLHGILAEGRLVSILGPGGVGKTHLATQVAHDRLDRHPGGVWFIDLVPVSDPAFLPQIVLDLVDLPDRAEFSPEAALIRHLSRKHALLIFDNCEHLTVAAARLIGHLLSYCPHLTVLATSRQPLTVPGETVYPLRPLEIPTADPAAMDPGSLLRCASVSLFAERARDADPGFGVTRENAAAVVQICRRLDGIPLALELAAARVRALPAESIAARLTDQFSLLSGGRAGPTPHHQSLRSLMDWSYELLDPVERTVFARLSVFVGDWSLEAAEAICGGGIVPEAEVAMVLADLVDRSLVHRVRQEKAPRYHFLETVRAYATARLQESGEEQAGHNRHRDWFRQLLREAAPHLMGPGVLEWQERLDADRDNIRAALTWSVESEIRIEMALDLWRYWWEKGLLREGLAWMGGSLERLRGDEPNGLVLQAYSAAGALAWRLGDRATASRHAAAALTRAEEAGDLTSISRAGMLTGILHMEAGRLEEAAACYTRSVEIRRAMEDDRAIAAALTNLAFARTRQGRNAEAAELATEGLQLAESFGDPRAMANARGTLATARYGLGEYAEARRLWNACLEHDTALGHQWGIASSYINLGDVALREGNSEEAARLYADGLRVGQAMDDAELMTNAIEGLAEIAAREDRATAAVLLGFARRQRERLEVAISSNRAGGIGAWSAALLQDKEAAARGAQLTLAEAARLALGTAEESAPDPMAWGL
jgi:predicted ATPase/DNA-binding SARP family transcriptional activator